MDTAYGQTHPPFYSRGHKGQTTEFFRYLKLLVNPGSDIFLLVRGRQPKHYSLENEQMSPQNGHHFKTGFSFDMRNSFSGGEL